MDDGTSIAVIGLSGRFPGARTVTDYWRNLRQGVCSISDLTDDQLRSAGVPADESGRADYVAAKGLLEDSECFEGDLFGFTPVESAALDPQHRLLLEAAWSALEDAGHDPRRAPTHTGVFVSGSLSEHMIAAHTDQDLNYALGPMQVRLLTDRDFLAPWISYRLDLTGPSLNVQAACAGSLAAVHLAVQSLLLGECDTALAGGVSVQSPRPRGYRYVPGGIGSPDGRCRPFSEEAAGTLSGNGVGLVVLRRLADALADGDPVRAVIRGSALTNDGGNKLGFTAPGPDQQTAALREAWATAGLHPSAAQYLELHGTATALGDQVEAAATGAALAPAAAASDFAIGSVKSNIGHLDAAAGIAGLVKLVLMLEHRTLVPTVNVSRPHPALAAGPVPLRLVTAEEPWPAPASGPRLGGVTSIGIGGTNVHVVVAEPSAPDSSTAGEDWCALLPLAAGTPAQLAALAAAHADLLRGETAPGHADVAHTLQTARTSFPFRATVVASDRSESAAALERLAHRITTGDTVRTEVLDGGNPAPVLVFPGQATEYPGLGHGLHRRFPAFREAMDHCADILMGHHGIEPRSWLAGPAAHGTQYWQPALLSFHHAFARLWKSFGIEPGAVLGHSAGEFPAAVLAGVLSMEDALELSVFRGQLMAETAPGRMLAVALSAADAQEFLGEGVALAASTGPHETVLSGSGDALATVVDRLTRSGAGAAHRWLTTDRGFHSALMEPVLDRFAERVSQVRLNAPALPWISTLTGMPITAAQATSPDYWAQQIRRPVLLHAAVGHALDAFAGPLLDLGPGRTVKGADARVLTVLGRENGSAAEPAAVLRALGVLWERGHTLDWTGVRHGSERRVHLPTYPFAGPDLGSLSLARTPRRTQDGAEATTGTTATGTTAAPSAVPSAGTGQVDDPVSAVSKVFTATLGLTQDGDLDQSYFAVGGDSLTAVHLVGRFRNDLDIEVPVALLLEPISLRELIGRIVEITRSSDTDPMLVLLAEIESEEPVDCRRA